MESLTRLQLPAASVLCLLLACGDDGSGADTDSSSGGNATDPAGSSSTTTSSSGSTSTTETTTSSSTSSSSTTTTQGSSEGSTTEGEEGSSSSTGEFVGSAGCGIPNGGGTNEWAGYTVDVGGMMRDYWVWLPEPYDPNRAYPVVYQFHGCSSNENRQDNNPPVQDQSGAEAIHVRGRSVGDCWDLAAEGPDVLFFDALLAAVETQYCADPRLRLATGYSSGAFMSHRLACDRGEVLRGVATIAGGVAPNPCPGSVAALLIHDTDDGTVMLSASETARDVHLARNGCDTEAPTTPVEPAPCQAYAGCDADYPVVWCQTSGQDHSRQDGLSAPAFWDFLSVLGPIDPA